MRACMRVTYSGPNDSSGYDKPFLSPGCVGPEPVDTTSAATHDLDQPPASLETHTTWREDKNKEKQMFL